MDAPQPLGSPDEGASPEAHREQQRRANRRLTLQLSVFALGFLGFGFLLVPLYNVLCDITGFGDRKELLQAATLKESTVAPRDVVVEFIPTLQVAGEWEFHPVVSSMTVRTGQLTSAQFIIKNLLTQPVTGQAVPSIAPGEATGYFRKTECFCFSPQHFEAGEQREFTVRFVVDGHLPPNLDRITLGYRMYGVKSQQVAASGR